jgi:hypothetical protein
MNSKNAARGKEPVSQIRETLSESSTGLLGSWLLDVTLTPYIIRYCTGPLTIATQSSSYLFCIQQYPSSESYSTPSLHSELDQLYNVDRTFSRQSIGKVEAFSYLPSPVTQL